MSAAPQRAYRAVPARPVTSPPVRADHLRSVAMPSGHRSLAGFAVVCVTIVVASLALVLIINTTMAAGAYERRELRLELAQLHQDRAALITALEAHAAPDNLAAAAVGLGMEPASTLGFVSLEQQRVAQSDGTSP